MERGFTAIEAAALVAVLGSLAAVAVPACARELHASKLTEATAGLGRIESRAAAMSALPESAPLTPGAPPRGKPAVDPPGAWDHPTWRALDFRASPEGVPHLFSFEVDSRTDELFARAHGDLDGDGAASTFEIRCVKDERGVRAVPGMYVESEVE